MRKALPAIVLVIASGSPAFAQGLGDLLGGIDILEFFTTQTTPPLAGREFICQAVNLSGGPLAINMTILDDGGADITNPPTNPFISCESGQLAPGAACTMRAGSSFSEHATTAYCRVSYLGAARDVRASLGVFDANGGGVGAAVAAE